MRYHRDRAFTLVELLVVIGIIALLMSILLPTMARARKSANSVACMSNLRQLTIAMTAYADANKGNTMPFDMTPGKYWHHMLAPHLGDPRYDVAADDPELVMSKVMLCPEAPKSDEGGTTYGSAARAWHYLAGQGVGSYGLNLWLIPKNTTYPMPAGRYWHKIFTAKGGGTEVPVVGDCNWVGSWPDNNDIVLPDKYQTGWSQHATGYFMGRFVLARHGRAVNMGFLDGSVRRMELADLWRLRWHKQSVPRDVVMP